MHEATNLPKTSSSKDDNLCISHNCLRFIKKAELVSKQGCHPPPPLFFAAFRDIKSVDRVTAHSNVGWCQTECPSIMLWRAIALKTHTHTHTLRVLLPFGGAAYFFTRLSPRCQTHDIERRVL